MPKVSVVIPVYRVEAYMERCAVSLFSQTLEDMEFIFVDDGSPDRSMDILREVLQRYPDRIPQTRLEAMPVHSGLAAVRKKGLLTATGDFVITCDSDDYVDPDMYGELYRSAIRQEADLVQCDIEVRNGDQVVRVLTAPPGDLGPDALREGIISGEISNSLCNKLVRRDLYQRPDFVFPAGDLDEDNVMSVQLAYHAQHPVYRREPFYKACRNPQSVTHKPGKEQEEQRFRDSYLNSRIIVDFLESHGYAAGSKAVLKAKLRPKRRKLSAWRKIYPEVTLGMALKFLLRH